MRFEGTIRMMVFLKTTKSQRNLGLSGHRRIKIPSLRIDETEVFEEFGDANKELLLITVGVQGMRAERF
jgi:hypothetical protein